MLPRDPRPFLTAGVGASAGGLAATTELLRNLGSAPGIAIVIVHHLDPTHESSLVEIFSKATTLLVATATDGAIVERDRIYVVPPNAGVVVSDGLLHVTPRTEKAGLHLPIDQFLESLAEDCGFSAIGVVLSGTGFDGTQGIKAIKAAGGITFAQDATAQCRSMPASAAATGCVDFVLPPEAIGRELAKVWERPPVSPEALSGAQEDRDLSGIVDAVRKSSGVDFASYKHATLRRRIQRRVFLHRCSSLREYAELLKQSPDELAALGEDLLIHVTSFFRDPDVFEALKASVFPKIVQGRSPDVPLRIWVPGCSSGEEVYSIAMSLLEFIGEAGADVPIKIFGTDVSSSAIDRARAARYPESIERDVSPERLQRFFVADGSGHQIARPVRDLCVFARQDTTRDPPFSGIDLISCRNLMIYLGAALQDRVLPIFHYALREPGFLVLGTAETIRSFVGFTVVDAKNRIYARTSAAPRLAFDFADRHFLEQAPASAFGASKGAQAVDLAREADRIVVAEVAPPGVVVTDDLAIVQFRGRTGSFLQPTPGAASLDLLRMARDELRLPLRRTIEEARVGQKVARSRQVLLDPRRIVDIAVIPFVSSANQQRYFVVLFKEEPPVDMAAPDVVTATSEDRLKEELGSTRRYLESVIEQVEASNEDLRAANEEIVSSNEELRSTNEELQTAKEELQATNEELRTVNEEMVVRSADASRVTDDLTNVLSSVEIPILLLGRDSRIRRYTPAAANVFRLVPSDVGRPLAEITSTIQTAELPRMIADVLERLAPSVRAAQDETGRWYQLSARPYLTLDKRIDGVVLTAVDVDATRRAGELREYQDKLRAMAFDAAVAEEAERRRIAVSLHDQIGQSLALAQIKVVSARDTVTGVAREELDRAVELLEQCNADVRVLTFDLSPPVLYDLGLEAALAWLAEDVEKRHGVRIDLVCDDLGVALDSSTAALLFRSVRELLINVIKHAKTSAAKVSLTRVGDRVGLAVEDEGVGFDAANLSHVARGDGFGLFSVCEQINRLGGTVEIDSTPRAGTRVRMRVPLERAKDPRSR